MPAITVPVGKVPVIMRFINLTFGHDAKCAIPLHYYKLTCLRWGCSVKMHAFSSSFIIIIEERIINYILFSLCVHDVIVCAISVCHLCQYPQRFINMTGLICCQERLFTSSAIEIGIIFVVLFGIACWYEIVVGGWSVCTIGILLCSILTIYCCSVTVTAYIIRSRIIRCPRYRFPM